MLIQFLERIKWKKNIPLSKEIFSFNSLHESKQGYCKVYFWKYFDIELQDQVKKGEKSKRAVAAVHAIK